MKISVATLFAAGVLLVGSRISPFQSEAYPQVTAEMRQAALSLWDGDGQGGGGPSGGDDQGQDPHPPERR